MAGLIGAASTWAEKVRSLGKISRTKMSRKKADGFNTAKGEVTTQTGDLEIDQAVLDQNLAVEVPHDAYSPIDRLPTEHLLYIFHYDVSGIKCRLTLTHVCLHWRRILIACGSLWTSITINIPAHKPDKSFWKFISLLDLQLERTQNLPLDVVWHICGSSNRTDAITDHIRQNGPFRRWKTLTLSIGTIYRHGILPTDSFPNLESLVLLQVYNYHILKTINLTTTSKLRTLDIRLSGTPDEDIDKLYGAMLKRVARLALASGNGDDTVNRLPPIPTKIIDIETGRRITHPFPHVKTDKLSEGPFRPGPASDLQSLTNLIVMRCLTLQTDFHLVLPSLQRFVCAHIILNEGSVLEAPQLRESEFCNHPTILLGPAPGQFRYIRAILDHPGFLLTPTTSLLIEPSLPADLIIRMLTRYSSLEKLELKFNDDMTVWKVTVAMAGEIGGSDATCPRLTELRLRFTLEYRARHRVEWWKDRAAQLVHGRKGCAASLCIYGAWYEGETCMLLA